MEKPDTGRAIITDIYNGVEIVVPARQSVAGWVSALFALGFCIFVSYSTFFSGDPQLSLQQPGGLLMLMVLVIMAISLIFSLYQLWWSIRGREVVTLADGVLTIEKKHSPEKSISYDLHSAENFRSVRDVLATGRGQGFINGYPWQLAIHGTVKFDYGVDIIQFGDWLSEAEGEYILTRLRAKKLIS